MLKHQCSLDGLPIGGSLQMGPFSPTLVCNSIKILQKKKMLFSQNLEAFYCPYYHHRDTEKETFLVFMVLVFQRNLKMQTSNDPKKQCILLLVRAL